MDPPPIQPHPQSHNASDSAPRPPPLPSPISVQRAPQPRRPRPPAPRVYRVHPRGFRKLVQQLTGAPSPSTAPPPPSPPPSPSMALSITNNDDNAMYINGGYDQSGSSSNDSNWWPHNNTMLGPGTMESIESVEHGSYYYHRSYDDHDNKKI